MKKNLTFAMIFCFCLTMLSSCGLAKKVKDIQKPVDLRTSPLDPDERAKRNIKEGRGITLGNLRGSSKTTYEFSTSNPMWRASLEVLDFIPLTTVDYSGGMIITDWYSDGSTKNREALKISVRFLSNELRSDSIKILVHKKNCNISENCGVNLLPQDSKINSELLSVILRKAAAMQEDLKKKPVKK